MPFILTVLYILKVGSLEGYLESLPQYFLLTLFAITKGGLMNCQMESVNRISFASQNYTDVTCGEDNSRNHISTIPYYQMMGNEAVIGPFYMPQHYWFGVTYNLTMMSCALAIVKFLDVGPTRIFEKDGWRNTVGYCLSFLSVLSSLITKTRGLGTGGYIMCLLYKNFGFGK